MGWRHVPPSHYLLGLLKFRDVAAGSAVDRAVAVDREDHGLAGIADGGPDGELIAIDRVAAVDADAAVVQAGFSAFQFESDRTGGIPVGAIAIRSTSDFKNCSG